jgi:hypothetical protein
MTTSVSTNGTNASGSALPCNTAAQFVAATSVIAPIDSCYAAPLPLSMLLPFHGASPMIIVPLPDHEDDSFTPSGISFSLHTFIPYSRWSDMDTIIIIDVHVIGEHKDKTIHYVSTARNLLTIYHFVSNHH